MRFLLIYTLLLVVVSGCRREPGEALPPLPETPAASVAPDSTGRITGTVTDASGAPIAMASVYISELKLGAAAGPDGRFTLTRIPPGTHEVTVSADTRQAAQQVDVTAGETVQLDLVLE